MTGPDDYARVLAQLELLRRSGDRRVWAKLRRLVIAAPCCERSALVEVMDTDPPCVLVRQLAYGHTDPGDPDRKPWQGSRRGDQGIVWLAAFERMADRSAHQIVPCRHGRWRVPAADVVARRGRHVLPVTDKCS